MTPTDAVRLAGYIRAHFPSQPIDDYTADALGEILAPYQLETCRTAVLALAMRVHEGDTGRAKWCSPTDVYAEVRRQRAKRIAEAEPVRMPAELDPDDTDAYVAALVESRLDAAAGKPPRHADPMAHLPARKAVRELGQIGASVDVALAARPVREAHAEAKRKLQAAQAADQAKREQRQAKLEAQRQADRQARHADT